VLVLATMGADVKGVVRVIWDVRQISFAPQDEAVALTGMEFGGITPLGSEDWPVLSTRGSELLVPRPRVGRLPAAEVLRLAQ
jgi:hypothetical protein